MGQNGLGIMNQNGERLADLYACSTTWSLEEVYFHIKPYTKPYWIHQIMSLRTRWTIFVSAEAFSEHYKMSE